MNYRIVLTLALLALGGVAQATSLCSEKEQDISREIGYAEKNHNQSRINGLKTALSQVRKNCNSEKLRAEHHQDIVRSQHDVAERKAELAEARRKGDRDKIAKHEKKLAKAEQELKELKARNY